MVVVFFFLQDLFTPFTCNLNDTAGGGHFVSRVLQKAYVEMSEEGTEAAAATMLEESSESADEDDKPTLPEFICDQPFLWVILHGKTAVPVFSGQMSN